jgi:hypothetical protein
MKHALRIEDLHVSTFAPNDDQPFSPLSAPAHLAAGTGGTTGTDSCWGSWCPPKTITNEPI